MASLAGVEYEGLGVVTQTATLHVSADFSPPLSSPGCRAVASAARTLYGADTPSGSGSRHDDHRATGNINSII